MQWAGPVWWRRARVWVWGWVARACSAHFSFQRFFFAAGLSRKQRWGAGAVLAVFLFFLGVLIPYSGAKVGEKDLLHCFDGDNADSEFQASETVVCLRVCCNEYTWGFLVQIALAGLVWRWWFRWLGWMWSRDLTVRLVAFVYLEKIKSHWAAVLLIEGWDATSDWESYPEYQARAICADYVFGRS